MVLVLWLRFRRVLSLESPLSIA